MTANLEALRRELGSIAIECAIQALESLFPHESEENKPGLKVAIDCLMRLRVGILKK